MTDSHLPDFAINLAASLTFELLKAGGQWLKRRAFGTEQEQAIRAIYQPALARTLAQVLPDYDPVLQNHIGEVLKEFVKDEHIAEQLLGLAFKEDVSLDDLRAQFDERFDSETIAFDELFSILIDELEAEALAKASQAESPLFNQVILAMVLEVRDSLRDLKSKQRGGLNLPSQLDSGINTIPPPPLHFIPRQATMKRLRDALLSNETGNTIAITAISGMGGLGKSVLAAAVAHDVDVQAAYPNGIVWVSIGNEPNGIAEQMKLVGKALGDSEGYYNSREAAVARLRAFLPTKSALLILDDVWELAHIEDFRIEAPRCRTLITTRKSEIANTLGATQVPLDIMTEEEAQELLAAWAEVPINQLPQEAGEVAHECGYLPLALAMIGAMVKNRISWANVYNKLKNADLSNIKQKLSHYEHTNLYRALHVSVEELDSDLKERYFDLCIFREEKSVPRATLEKYWQPLGLTADETEDVIRALEGRSLIRVDDAMRVSMHDLQLDYIRIQVPDKAPLHDRLLNGYNPNRRPWHLIADDYLFESLVYHLQNAKREGELTKLFANHDWMHVRHANSGYMYTGYIEDLETVWFEIAGEQLAEQIYSDADMTALNDCVRLALIRTAINSLAGNYHPAILARAVEQEIWTLERALTVVLNMIDSSRQVETYTQLLKLPNLPVKQQREMMDKGLQIAMAIRDENFRADALTVLAPVLSGEQIEHALQGALAIREESACARALKGLAPMLSDEQIDRAVQAALAFDWKFAYADALAGLAPVLTGEKKMTVIDRALQAALAINDAYLHARALAELAQVLTGEQIDRALQAALAINDAYYHARALAGLAPVLTGEQIDRALQAALAINDKNCRVRALAGLAPVLTGEQKASVIENALQAVSAFHSEDTSVDVLRALAPLLTSEQTDRALRAALAIRNEFARAHALEALAPVLIGEQIDQALQAALAIYSDYYRADALAELAPVLNAEQIGYAMQAALTLASENALVCALAGLAPVLTGEKKMTVIEHALQTALAINDKEPRVLKGLVSMLTGEQIDRALQVALALNAEHARADALVALAPMLTGEQIDRALQVALAINNAYYHAHALAGLAPVLTGEKKLTVIEYALQAALAISDHNARAHVLVTLAPMLSGEQTARCLGAALAIDDEVYRVHALAVLAPVLNGEQIEYALQAALTLGDSYYREQALAALAPVLSNGQIDRALQAALVIDDDEYFRPEALTALAPRLSGKQIEYAFHATSEIGNENHRADVLRALAPKLSREQVEPALRTGFGLQFDDARASILLALLPLHPDLSEEIAWEIRNSIALFLFQVEIWELQFLLPFLGTKGLFAPPIVSEQVTSRIIEDIEDVCTRWRWV